MIAASWPSVLAPRLPVPRGESDKFSTVARSSSTEADIGVDPFLSGFISTCIFRSLSSSESESEVEQ